MKAPSQKAPDSRPDALFPEPLEESAEASFINDLRRSTRIALRAFVRISIKDSPNKTFDAWTVVVNDHGALFQTTRPFPPGEEIGIATFTGKISKATVVWGKMVPNSQGNFEFAAEMDQPGILFSVLNHPEKGK